MVIWVDEYGYLAEEYGYTVEEYCYMPQENGYMAEDCGYMQTIAQGRCTHFPQTHYLAIDA